MTTFLSLWMLIIINVQYVAFSKPFPRQDDDYRVQLESKHSRLVKLYRIIHNNEGEMTISALTIW